MDNSDISDISLATFRSSIPMQDLDKFDRLIQGVPLFDSFERWNERSL